MATYFFPFSHIINAVNNPKLLNPGVRTHQYVGDWEVEHRAVQSVRKVATSTVSEIYY